MVAKITVFALEKHSTLQWFLYNSFGTNTTVLRAAAILDHVRIRKIIPPYLRRTQTGQNVDQQHVNENTMLVEIYCLVCVHLYKGLNVDRWILFWKLLSPNLRFLVFWTIKNLVFYICIRYNNTYNNIHNTATTHPRNKHNTTRIAWKSSSAYIIYTTYTTHTTHHATHPHNTHIMKSKSMLSPFKMFKGHLKKEYQLP